jgi:hypothetical protein
MTEPNFYSLKTEIQKVALKSAMTYFRKNKDSIYFKVSKTEARSAPGVNLALTPEKWSESHWRWFLDNSFLL